MYFSVIIPLYNKEDHIERAIESVLKQTFQNFEIIVVDDGSTDDGAKKVKEMLDSRIKLIKQNNQGVSSARNTGICNASYDYIGLLDADDMWKPWFLSSISNLIKQYSSAGAYATSYEIVRDNDLAESAELNINLKEDESGIVNYFKGSLKAPLISASSVVIPKSVFDTVGTFSTDLTRGEDLEMWCRIALQYKVAFLNKVSSSYFHNAKNRACTKNPRYSESFMSRAQNILEEEQEKGNNSFYFEEYMIKRIIPKIRYLLDNDRVPEARILLEKYKHTKLNKKQWFKSYLLSYKVFRVAKNIKSKLG